MVHTAGQCRQQRSRVYVNVLVLTGLSLLSGAVGADTLQRILFEPQALPDVVPVHAGAVQPATRLSYTLSPAPAPLLASALSSAPPTFFDRTTGTADSAALHRIAQLQDEQGPYAIGLATEYLALGRLYQEAANYDEAIAAYAQAEHISRMHHGLDAPEQYLPIELSIDSYLAKQDFRNAVERQEYLVYLNREHYGYEATEVVPELLTLGNLYFDAFERGIQRTPAEAELQLPFGPESDFLNPQDLSPIDTAFQWLDQARIQYFTSIKNLVTREDYVNPLLPDLETSLIETFFLQAFRRNIELDPLFFLSARNPNSRDLLQFDQKTEQLPLYRAGEEAFTRILAYLRANPAVKPAQVAEAMLQLGDWHLLFGKYQRGMAQYEAARAYLAASGTSESDIAHLLNPPVPVQLPAFREQPHSRALIAPGEEVVFDGYIDVALTLNRWGQVKHINVLEKSANADDAIEARLRKVLRNAPFRPRLAAEPAEKTVTLRYNFAQL